MSKQSLKLLKNRARPKAETTLLHSRTPRLSPAEQAEAHRFKLRTLNRAARQRKVRTVTTWLEQADAA